MSFRITVQAKTLGQSSLLLSWRLSSVIYYHGLCAGSGVLATGGLLTPNHCMEQDAAAICVPIPDGRWLGASAHSIHWRRLGCRI